MKVGDKMYCHTDCLVDKTKKISLSKDKIYTIININESFEVFILIDNNNKEHMFTIYTDNYKKWLSSLREARKEKLEKLKKIK